MFALAWPSLLAFPLSLTGCFALTRSLVLAYLIEESGEQLVIIVEE